MMAIENEQQKYSREFKEKLAEVYDLARGKKTEAYGETWKRTGLRGIYIKLMIKEGRLKEMVWRQRKLEQQDESVRDTLQDIAAYAIYGIICYDEGNLEGVDDLDMDLELIKKELSR